MIFNTDTSNGISIMKFLKITFQKDNVKNQHCTYFAHNVNLWQYLPKLEVYLK